LPNIATLIAMSAAHRQAAVGKASGFDGWLSISGTVTQQGKMAAPCR
jgi:hypothetical protein